jgi:hypothetical protein
MASQVESFFILLGWRVRRERVKVVGGSRIIIDAAAR